MSLLAVNPIGIERATPASGMVGKALTGLTDAVSLGSGAIAGGMLGSLVARYLPSVTADEGSFANLSSRLLVNSLLAYVAGIPFSYSRMAAIQNIRVGLQAGLLASSVQPLADRITGGAIIKAQAAAAGVPLSGFIPSDFGGQMPPMASLQRTVGQQYFLGAGYGHNPRGVKVGRTIPTQYNQAWISRGPQMGGNNVNAKSGFFLN